MRAKPIIAKDATELAEILGLTPADGAEIQLRSELNDKIIEAVHKSGLKHEQVAKLARTSRSRMTAILNRNTKDVSTDLMLRIMASLGYRAKLTFSEAATDASKSLGSKSTRSKSKTAGGRALSQLNAPAKGTSKPVASTAAKVLRDGRSSRPSKSAVGSALSQRTIKSSKKTGTVSREAVQKAVRPS